MKVSIVIPTFNPVYIVAEAIRSALAQSHRAFEIVGVNDGSVGDSDDVIEHFVRNAGVKPLKQSKNRGCGAAYNTGMSAAEGILIAILDSDDVWSPSYLAREVAFLSRQPELDASLPTPKFSVAASIYLH